MGLHSHPQLLGQHGHSHRSCRRDFSELVTLATQDYLFDRERGCKDALYVAEELGQPLYDFSQSSGVDDVRFGGHAAMGKYPSARRARELWRCGLRGKEKGCGR